MKKPLSTSPKKKRIIVNSIIPLFLLLFVTITFANQRHKQAVLGLFAINTDSQQNQQEQTNTPWWWFGQPPSPEPPKTPYPFVSQRPTEKITQIPTSTISSEPTVMILTVTPTLFQQQQTAIQSPTPAQIQSPANQSNQSSISTPTPTSIQIEPTSTPQSASSQNPVNIFVNYVVSHLQPVQQSTGAPTITPPILLTATPVPQSPIITELKTDGTVVTLSDGELEKLSNILQNDDRPQIKRGTNNTTLIIKNDAIAQTTFPLSINQSTEEISITTEIGQRVIHIYPDQIITILKQQKIANAIGAKITFDYLLHGPTTQNIQAVMQLASVNGEATYIIPATINKKLLSLVPVTINNTIYISAETGEVTNIKTNIGNTIVNSLSQ